MDQRVFQWAECCAYCEAKPDWRVYENRYTPDYMLVCDEHKTLPYS